jgi:hypothetical protein
MSKIGPFHQELDKCALEFDKNGIFDLVHPIFAKLYHIVDHINQFNYQPVTLKNNTIIAHDLVKNAIFFR